MKIHHPFPKIGQYRNAISEVNYSTEFVGKNENGEIIKDLSIKKPILKYHGTPKLHGTNAAIVFDYETKEIYVQSRKRIISIKHDNNGFAWFIDSIPNIKDLFYLIPNYKIDDNDHPSKDHIVIYGEWCGKGIQKGVGINEIERMFVIFAIKYQGVWLSNEQCKNIKMPEHRIFNINDFANYEIVIDFNDPEASSSKLADLTNEVEKTCPVAKSFGAKNTTGEGIVWTCVTPGWKSSRYWFKVKGEKHKVTKTKKIAPSTPEDMKSINKFVENVVTKNRLQQGVHAILNRFESGDFEPKMIGAFLKWMNEDILNEESDTMHESQIPPKIAKKYIIHQSREWLFKNILKEI